MAEGVLFNFAEGIIDRLTSRAFQEMGLIWGVKDELLKLQETVAQIQAVLLDAEQKQATHAVKLWLQSLEDVVDEADDVLDEFYAEAQWRQMMPGNNHVLKQVCIFFSSSNQLAFRLKMGHKIKSIKERLNVIASRRNFHLEVSREDTRFRRVTHSFAPTETIIGRNEDKNAIKQLLFDTISEENVSIISIVGFGGLGKTALAQLVFNDLEVQTYFELKMWICVSNVFELYILVKQIIQSATNNIAKSLEIDLLQKELRKIIDGKRYLLVLDDVWNDNREKWFGLQNLLMGGGKGSKILITTRSEKVAKITDTSKPYNLRGLSEEQSWFLFKKMAFQDGKEPTSSTIKALGEEIARKCKGVPLAIRTIGRMLYTRDPETEWSAFKNNKLSTIRQEENDIFPTLQLSYDVLPSHLKHCFAYCSLFPPDYKIPVEKLIRLWVAQGFVKSSNPNECLEDVGYEYYNELVWRSFFQEEEKDEFGIIRSCKMHDLMNELAVKVAGEGSRIIDRNKTDFDAKRLLHVSFDFDVDFSESESESDSESESKIPTSLLESNKLRTFLLLRQDQWRNKFMKSIHRPLHKSFCATIALNLKSLRILSLNGLRIPKLPKCLRKMKHLRYLDLSVNAIVRLPNWIVKFQNLETLNLHLILRQCYQLAWIPRGLGELICLRTLSRFVLSIDNSMLRDRAGLNELGRLKDLRGKLNSRNLRHKKDMMSELNYDDAILKEKRHLYSLTLHWMHIERENSDAVEEESDVIIKSMEALQPHSSLKDLTLEFYMGARFASWFHSLTNIVNLRISDCTKLASLPEGMGNFKSLQLLGIWACPNLASLPEGLLCLASLKKLIIENCPILKQKYQKETGEDWSKIAHIPEISIYDSEDYSF
ncbi:hypothetical protein PRUPE_2G014000 [Prunus persica]|uniref:Disease resistance protein RGA3 n=1 Tax=Prunus persica TaxID=3760 RepID=A0A251Q9D1_PRUPE|nr:hypothetical protein PRUPE_2G014000 [Prunus persica]